MKEIEDIPERMREGTATPNKMVSDQLRDEYIKHPAHGVAFCAGPFEMRRVFDFTGLRGSGSNIYYSLIYQLPKWKYFIRKVDEFIEVTPTWAEYYNLTIAQKQKLEASIKQGLTSAAQAVSDFELLKHDLRRYREVLDYFKNAAHSKDEHVLRSLFVDRVDAHIGEGYSMITMAKRWPTIITDFIRMSSDLNDPEEIRKGLDVSAAEATVLLTKNQLYTEWKTLFLPEIKDRVARLQVLVESRKKSIDQYRSWLKPYVSRYKAIREKTELNPTEYISDPYHTPGFGQSQAVTGVRLWFWKGFNPAEKGKPEKIIEKGIRRGFIIDPFDDVVREWIPKIEQRYGVRITDKDVEKVIKNAVAPVESYLPSMDPKAVYYVFYNCTVILNLIRTPPPEGIETDNLMFVPIKAHIMSQNILLVHLIEIYAREKSLEKELNDLIGSRESEEEARERIEEEFVPKKMKKKRLWGARQKTSSAKRRAKPPLQKLFNIFVKKGPYENIFYERGSKMYARAIGGEWGTITGFIMNKMQVI